MPSRPLAVCHTDPSPVPEEPAWAVLVAALPEGEAALERSARAYGAVRRRREVQSASDLLRLALAYAVAGWSLRFTAAWAEVVGLALLSEAALRRRFRQAQPWLAHLVATLVLEARHTERLPQAHVRLIDASVICAPGATGTPWRIHLSATVAPIPRIDGVERTDYHGGETLRRHTFAADEIAVADRGDCHPRALQTLDAQGTHFVVRYAWQMLPLHTATGRPVDLDVWLPTIVPSGTAEQAVRLATDAPTAARRLRLVAVALPEEVANQARARLRREARRKGRTPQARSLLVAGYVVVLTNLPADRWDAAAVLALYRVRWQVELVFKRLKGLWHLGALRARTPGAAQAVLLSGLLAALLAERVAHPLGVPRVDGFAAVERPVSLWRWTALWHQVVHQALTGTLPLTTVTAVLPLLQRHLCDTPRRRRQQAALARQSLQVRTPLPVQLPLFRLSDLAHAA